MTWLFFYQGFTQDANVRSFQFDHTTEISYRKTVHIAVIVKADLSLFLRAHVPVQDGPALCLHVLGGLVSTADLPLPFVHTITAEELAAFAGLRTARAERLPHRRRRHLKPSAASQLHWTSTSSHIV